MTQAQGTVSISYGRFSHLQALSSTQVPGSARLQPGTASKLALMCPC